MRALEKVVALAVGAALVSACGASPELSVETDPTTRKYTNVELHYQPTLIAACGDMDLEAPKFSFDSAKLRTKDQAELTKLAECLDRDALKSETLYVVGHADPRGDAKYNRDLGAERAKAVRDSLVANGVAVNRIKVTSHGESHASMKAWDWPQDRRVDIGITTGGKWSFVQTEGTETVPGKTVPGVFEERADTDGDGVDEPGVYPKETVDAAGKNKVMTETGDPDGDGADEPEE